MKQQGHPSNTQPDISRRSFVELAVGAVTMLPAVSGGFALAFTPEVAHGNGGVSPSTEIVIAKPNEAGIAVAELVDKKRTPVAGAAVTIKSNENGKVVTGKTGDNGVFLADLSTIAKPTKNANGVNVYTVEASVAVEKEGYRVFETGWMSLKGGAGFDVPTQKIGNELAYPKRATLSDWDIMYTNNEFAVTPANDEKHTILIAFCTKSAGRITASIVNEATNATVAKGAAKASGNGKDGWRTATISCKGAFMLKGHKDAFPISSKYKITYSVDGEKYSAPIHLRTVNVPSALTAPFTKKMAFAPFSETGMSLSFRMPKWVPLAGGQEVDLWKPDLPIDISADPYGYFRASLRTPQWGYKSKDGKVDGKAWKKLPRKSFEEQFSQAKQEMASYAMKSAAYMVNGSRSTFSAFPAVKSLQFTFSAEAVVAGRWSNESNALRGKGELRGVLGFAFSIAKQLFAGPVPFILQFDLNMSAMISVGCGVVIPRSPKGWNSWSYDFTSSGISFTFTIVPALSAGVGVKGVASVSLQGMLAFSVYVGAGPLPEGGKETNPHAVVGLMAKARVIIQLLFFTLPIELWSHSIPKLYDSWDPKKLYSNALLEAQAEASAPSFAEWFEKNPPAPMEIGDALAEFSGKGVELAGQGLSTQSGDDDSALEIERKVEEHTTDDGMTYRIMSFEVAGGNEHAVASVAGGGALAAASTSSLTEPGLQERGDSLQVQSALHTMASGYSALANAHDYVTEALEDPRKNLQLAAKTGMVPGSKQCIAKNVLSDPRVKIVSVYGRAVMFRIAAVKVQDKIRTRIVGQVLQTATKPAGQPIVFDFFPTIYRDKGVVIERNDLWDYDFDVVVLTNLHASYQSIQFFVISGLREDGTKFGQVATDQVFTHARFDVTSVDWDGSWSSGASAHGVWAPNFKFDDATAKKYPYHNFSCPHIEFAEDRPHEKETADDKDKASGQEVLCTFLDRAASKPDLALSDDSGNVRISVGFCSAGTIATDTDLGKFLMFDLSGMTAGHQDATIYELTRSKRLRKNQHCGYNIITLRGASKAYHYRVLTTVSHVENGLPARTRVMEAKLWHTSTHDGFLDDEETFDMMRLVDWPNHDGKYLAAVDGKLQSVEFTGLDGKTPKPKYTEVGPTDFSISSFGVDSTGTFLFYPTVSEGSPGFTYETSNGASDMKSKSVPKVNEHRIMACRLRNGKFSDPFVFSEVDYDLDDLNVVNVASDSVGFLSTNIIDVKKGQADLYYTNMPFVKCVNIIGCQAVSAFAYPNTEVLFDLTVRNDGNSYITGFTAQLLQKGGSKVESSKQVTFSANTLRESNFNPSENGKLKDVEDDFALAPGKTSVYRIGLTIPGDWQGKKSVCVKAVDVAVAPVKAAASEVAPQSIAALSIQADSEQADAMFVDGDVHASYEVSDEDAFEYLVGTNKSDYEDEPGFGEPYDVLQMMGDASFFDDDEYDDGDEHDDDDYNLQFAPVPLTGPGSTDEDGGDKNSGDKAKETARRSVPKTSDSLGAFPGLLVATTAAGAAMAAYSRRRIANERGEADEQGD